MHLSTKGRYAIMAMLDLAELARVSDRPVTLAQIAERQQISLSYLEQLFAKLRKGGVVDSARGPGGGYTLARGEARIMLLEVISAVEEVLDVTRCQTYKDLLGPKEGQGCVHGGKCNAHDLWSALGLHMETFFARVSLADVLEGRIGGVMTPMAGLGVRIEGVAE